MADIEAKVPVKTEEKPAERPAAPAGWRPFESLRREVDRLFEDFDRGSCHVRALAGKSTMMFRGTITI